MLAQLTHWETTPVKSGTLCWQPRGIGAKTGLWCRPTWLQPLAPWPPSGSPGTAPVTNRSFPSASGKRGHQDSLGLGCRLREMMYSAVLGIQVCAGQKSKLGRTVGWGGPLHSWGLCPGHRASRAVDAELGRCHQERPPSWRPLPGRSELGTVLTAPCPRTFY